jgi:hypothetical protein
MTRFDAALVDVDREDRLAYFRDAASAYRAKADAHRDAAAERAAHANRLEANGDSAADELAAVDDHLAAAAERAARVDDLEASVASLADAIDNASALAAFDAYDAALRDYFAARDAEPTVPAA